MTYSCLEISVMHIVNSQNSRNSLHIVINYCTKYILKYILYITYSRELGFFSHQKHTIEDDTFREKKHCWTVFITQISMMMAFVWLAISSQNNI